MTPQRVAGTVFFLSAKPETGASLRGPLAATACFLVWGVVPVFWKQMEGIPALELIAHRTLWSLLLLVAVQAVRGSFAGVRPALTDWRILAGSAVSSVLLATNWTVYVWAVNHGQVLEASLGYFLTPLANVALGCIFLRERLRALQWTAIALAALGVGLLLAEVGRVPWIALTLAGTWSCYGLCRKKSPLDSLAGLTVEVSFLLPFAVALLLWRAHLGSGAFGHVDLRLHVLLVSTGVVTAIPLLLFADAARRIRLATLGLLQFITPTAQFLLGRFFYHEPFPAAEFRAYALIWCGLVLYSADSFWSQRRTLLRLAGAT